MTLREAVVALLSSFNWNDAKWPEIVALRAALAQPEERGERDYHGCAFSGPGRGDCEHAVGLPGTPISGQHDGPDDTVDVYGRPNGWCWWCWHMRQIRLATEPEERGAEWREEGEEPTSPGWYAVQRKDGSLCLRAFGHGLWWIPLRDGWLSGLPAGFKWLGPVEPVEWDTPRSPPEEPRQGTGSCPYFACDLKMNHTGPCRPASPPEEKLAPSPSPPEERCPTCGGFAIQYRTQFGHGCYDCGGTGRATKEHP